MKKMKAIDIHIAQTKHIYGIHGHKIPKYTIRSSKIPRLDIQN